MALCGATSHCHGLPLALRAEIASLATVKLVEATWEERLMADVPE